MIDMSDLKERLKKKLREKELSQAKAINFEGEKMLVMRPNARVWRVIFQQIIQEFIETHGFDPSAIEEGNATPEQSRVVDLFNNTRNLYFQAMYLHGPDGTPFVYEHPPHGGPFVREDCVNMVTDLVLSSDDFRKRFGEAIEAANGNPSTPEQ